jgi:hypothetical protein
MIAGDPGKSTWEESDVIDPGWSRRYPFIWQMRGDGEPRHV